MELFYLMMKKLQKHSINNFAILQKNISLTKNSSIKELSVDLVTDPVKLALDK